MNIEKSFKINAGKKEQFQVHRESLNLYNYNCKQKRTLKNTCRISKVKIWENLKKIKMMWKEKEDEADRYCGPLSFLL